MPLASTYMPTVWTARCTSTAPTAGRKRRAAADASTHVFNSLCSNLAHVLRPHECPEDQSGIWARAGVVVDPATGNLFAVTGNGAYDANTGGNDWGDTVLELSPDGTRVLDSYTPADFDQLDASDADLGSTAPALLPRLPTSKTPDTSVFPTQDSSHFALVNGAVTRRTSRKWN